MDAVYTAANSAMAHLEAFYASFVPPAPVPEYGVAQPLHHDLAFMTMCFLVILVIDKVLEYGGYFSDFKNIMNNRKIRETR